jgi:CheY-like chemotaxis protein
MSEILIIEDEPEVLLGIRKGLERRGHKVTIDGTGKSAILELKSRRFDLIILDMLLPQGEGSDIDLAKLYQETYRENANNLTNQIIESHMGVLILQLMANEKIKTPIILLSAYINMQIMEKLVSMKDNLNIFMVFNKPASYSDIMNEIESALGKLTP